MGPSDVPSRSRLWGSGRACGASGETSSCRAAARDDAHPPASPARRLPGAPGRRRGPAPRRRVHRRANVRLQEPIMTANMKALASGQTDLANTYTTNTVLQVDAGDPVVLLAGVHVGCFELFGSERVRAVRD